MVKANLKSGVAGGTQEMRRREEDEQRKKPIMRD
jgi:hypothetical protein